MWLQFGKSFAKLTACRVHQTWQATDVMLAGYDATEVSLNDWTAKISQIVMLNATTSNGLTTSPATAIRGPEGYIMGRFHL